MMNFILSLIKYKRESKNLLNKNWVKFTHPRHWNNYKFLLANEQPIVCFKDEMMRVGNFFYAYPNVNLQMTFFASLGCLNYEVKEISKLRWVIMFLRKVR